MRRVRGERVMAGIGAVEGVIDVRGRGLMVGLTLAKGLDAPAIRDRCLEAGLVVNCPGSECCGSCRRSSSLTRTWRRRSAILARALAG